jgi:hypothetical protein
LTQPCLVEGCGFSAGNVRFSCVEWSGVDRRWDEIWADWREITECRSGIYESII